MPGYLAVNSKLVSGHSRENSSVLCKGEMNDKERASKIYRLLYGFNLLQLTCNLFSPFYCHNHYWTSVVQPLNNIYLNFFLKQHCQFGNEFVVFLLHLGG